MSVLLNSVYTGRISDVTIGRISLIINLEGPKRIRMFVHLFNQKKTVDILYITFYPQYILDASLRTDKLYRCYIYWYTRIHRRSKSPKVHLITLK